MRTLVAITLGETGGAQEHVRQLAMGMKPRGVDLAIMVQDPSHLADSARKIGAEVLPWASITRNPSPVADLRARRELRDAVARYRPNVLHLHSAKAGVLGRGLLKPPAGVTIYTCHHPPYGPGRQWTHRLVGRPIEQATLRWVDGIITVGARDMPMLRRLAPDVPIRLIRNGVSGDAEPRSPTAPVPSALWVARMARPKDPIQAIKVWERVVERAPGATLHLVGTGPLSAALTARIARSPARDLITHHGFVSDIGPFQEQASLFILTTAVEGGITMATLEALHEGLVPIMSDAGDAFLVSHAGCGVVVGRGAVRSAAAAIVSLLQDPDRLSSMRANALSFARKDWTADDMVDATVEWYRRVLARA